MDNLHKVALEEVMADLPAEEVERRVKETYLRFLTTALHLLCCRAEHGMECNFYSEGQMTETWDQPSHRRWQAIAYQFAENAGLDLATQTDLALNIINTLHAWSGLPRPVLRFARELLDQALEKNELINKLTEDYANDKTTYINCPSPPDLPESVLSAEPVLHGTGDGTAKKKD